MFGITELVNNLFDLLRRTFNPLFLALITFFNPAISVAVSITSLVAFLLGALQDPNGLLNTIAVSVIDNIAALWPSTPENLKVGNLLDAAALAMPAIGRGLIYEIFITVVTLFSLTVIVKIYKLIPFKAT